MTHSKKEKLTRYLWLTVFVVVAFNIALFLVGYFVIGADSWKDVGITLKYTIGYLTGYASTDSWDPMSDALAYLHKFPDKLLYTELFFDQKIKFQYPPSSLLLLEIFSIKFMNIISWISIVLMVWWNIILFQRASANDPAQTTEAGDEKKPIWRYVAIGGLSLMFFPVVTSYTLGQLQTLITFFGATALVCWQSGNKKLAGVFLGLASILKPHWGLVFLWGMMRKQWGMVIAGLSVVFVLVMTSVVMYGIGHYFDYLKVISFLGKHGESFFRNHSVNGLVNRMLFNGDNQVFSGNSFPPYNPIVYFSTLITSLVLIFSSLFWRYKKSNQVGVLDLSIVLLSLTIASPIAWDHHYGILLSIFAVLVPKAVFSKEFGNWLKPSLLIAFVLASQYIFLTNLLADTGFNFLQSYIFYASLFVLYLLYKLSKNDGARLASS